MEVLSRRWFRVNYCGVFYQLTDGKYGSEAGWVIKKRDAEAKKAREEAAKIAAPSTDTNAPALPK